MRSPVAGTKAIAATAAFLWFGFAGAPEAAERLAVDLELVLAVDVSGSIDAEEMKLQRDGYVAALTHPDVIQAITRGLIGRIAIAYVEWAGHETRRLVVDWAEIADRTSADAFAARLAAAPIRSGVSTSISGAIDYILPMFGANGYEGTRRVIDISGDGPSNQGAPVTDARDRAEAAGVIINGLPILNDRPNALNFPNLPDLDLYYEGCVISGDGAFVVVANNFEAFGEAVRRKLILEIADLPGPRRHYVGPPKPRLFRAAGTGAVYEKGCDIGERQVQEFYRRRGWGN